MDPDWGLIASHLLSALAGAVLGAVVAAIVIIRATE